MAAEDSNWAIDSYLLTERRVLEYLRHVPYDSAHKSTYSPELAMLLLDTCSLIESILKSSMDSARYDNITNIAQIRARRFAGGPFLSIGDLRDVFRGDHFHIKRVWLLSGGESSYPWYPWRTAINAPPPKWWTAYNRVKHDRFGEAKKARLENVIHALKGCFLVLVSALDFRERLVQRGIIRSHGLNARQLVQQATVWEPFATDQVVVAVSDAVGYKFLSNGSPNQAEDVTIFL